MAVPTQTRINLRPFAKTLIAYVRPPRRMGLGSGESVTPTPPTSGTLLYRAKRV